MDGEKTEMVAKSACCEGEVLEKWFVIKPCFIKNSRPLVFVGFFSLFHNCIFVQF